MTVKATILDRRLDGNNKCFLSKMSLDDYISALTSSYQEYDVQREIVSNVYLDHLVDTVLSKKHIPPIVLVADADDLSSDDNILKVNSFKILDGLQRTFRLQAIQETIKFCVKNMPEMSDALKWSKFKFSREFSKQLSEFGSNTDVLFKVLQSAQKHGKEELLKTFTENSQWFEIWTGLTPEDEVKKMLMLNAGHKPVKTRHQLELLFLNLLPIFRDGESKEFELLREKEISATQFSKNRSVGQFHFAHVITGLLSLYSGKPVAPTTQLIQNIQNSDSEFEAYMEMADPKILQSVVSFLVRLDKILTAHYGEIGCFWMGREVSLAGLFGAIGYISEKKEKGRLEVMENLYEVCAENPQILNLNGFERARNSLDLSKINIGNVNRSAVFSAIKELLLHPTPSVMNWPVHFGLEEE